jgi:hypothetical protein
MSSTTTIPNNLNLQTPPFGTARTEAQQDTRAAETEANAALRSLMEEQSKKIAEQALQIGTLKGEIVVLKQTFASEKQQMNEKFAAERETLTQRVRKLEAIVERTYCYLTNKGCHLWMHLYRKVPVNFAPAEYRDEIRSEVQYIETHMGVKIN